MSSCFPLFSKFKIPKISTSLSAIGTFFCYKRGGYEQSSTSPESPTNSSNSPTNNSDKEAINSSKLSGAIMQNGGESHSNSSSSPSMISISRESSVYYTLSRTQSSEFTPVDPSPPRNARGVSRSDAREDAKSPLRFTSAPEFSSKFHIDNSENNEDLKGNHFIEDYLDRIINNMKIRDSAKEDKASKSLSDPQNLDLHSKIMRGRYTAGKNYPSIPSEGARPNLNAGEGVGLGMRPSFTWVRAVGTEAASEATRRVKDAKENGGMMTF